MTSTGSTLPAGAFAEANASPTKAFFVRMLTRDIDLSDALLDLLDNCVDGIVRSGPKPDPKKPYTGFHARLLIDEKSFEISDNCGGIPVKIAEDYAFALGRPDDVGLDVNQATVGMYGIGMKRAIFKLGTNAFVESRHDRAFRVEITPDWMKAREWSKLPMYDLPSDILPSRGTKICVTDIHPEVQASFGSDGWLDEFKKVVSQHYALIIAKGFEVRIGRSADIDSDDALIPGGDFKLLETIPSASGDHFITPYIYSGTIEGVDIDIYAGLYRKLPTQQEAEAEEDTRGDSDDSGWTLACNDRIVIWKDKSRLTGWGEATVPNYHGQFIAITGLVLLYSDDVKRLPLTTTKRGIDGASPVYLVAKEFMRDATKHLTSFTNKWKKFPADLEGIYRQAEYLDVAALQARKIAAPLKASRRVPTISKFEPTYPTPKQEKTSVRVSFVAEKVDVARLAVRYFDDANAKPADVGVAAFNDALSRIGSGA